MLNSSLNEAIPANNNTPNHVNIQILEAENADDTLKENPSGVIETSGTVVGVSINHPEVPPEVNPPQIENGRGNNLHDNESQEGHLEYIKDYPIRRFSRRWRRQEVQGVCCLSLEITCLVALALVSLHSLGYMRDEPKLGYLPYSVSAKVLREFFTYEETPPALAQCFFGLEVPRTSDALPRRKIVGYYNSNGEFTIAESITFGDEGELAQTNVVRNKIRCNLKHSQSTATDWLAKFFSVNFLSVLTVITSAMFLLSISLRRRKGLQVVLLLPSFLCFFISIFQQIPVTFHYNYVSLAVREDLRNGISYSASGNYKSVPLLDQTQINMQCCGMDGPSTWEMLPNFNGSFPGSCCNTKKYDCAKEHYIPRKQVWHEGCYQKEYERIRTFERWSLLLLGFKILAEVGLFCTLSDLTRFEYPRPEAFETSRCDFRSYEMKCRGIAHIKGVTKDGRIVVQAKYLLPWRLLLSRTDLISGLTLQLRSEINRHKGSVEMKKRVNIDDFRSEDVHINLSKKNRGIYIFSLT